MKNNIKTKVEALSNEQLERLVQALSSFNCNGIDCSNCPLYQDGTCTCVVAYDEAHYREFDII